MAARGHARLGVDVAGVDLSPRRVAQARRLYAGLRFDVASATELALQDASLGGLLAWWSLFDLPRDVVPDVLRSFADALLPGGQVLVGTSGRRTWCAPRPSAACR